MNNRQALAVMVVLLSASLGGIAHEMPFQNTALATVDAAKVKERPVALIFDDLDFFLRDANDRSELYRIKYADVSRFAYEFSESPKFLAAPAAGSAKRHWLAVYYEEKGAPATMVLILDEYEYKNILTVAKLIAEKEVEGAPEE
jgi:hypothetical protein